VYISEIILYVTTIYEIFFSKRIRNEKALVNTLS